MTELNKSLKNEIHSKPVSHLSYDLNANNDIKNANSIMLILKIIII